MEEEAEKLMAENLSKNFIDYEEYPQSVELCVSLRHFLHVHLTHFYSLDMFRTVVLI